jgi:hypothetical protein
MIKFTPDQIQEMLNIMDKNTILYSIHTVGKEVLSNSDKDLLIRYGIDPYKIVVGFTPFEQAFYFSRLLHLIGDKNAGKLNYGDLLQYLKRGQFHPLSNREKEMLDIAKMKTYNHLKGMTDKHKQQFTSILTDVMQQGIKERKGVVKIVSELGHRTGDWQKDLGRIVETEYNTILQQGRAAEIEKTQGEEALVYKDVFPGACRFCIQFYLTNGVGSEPIIYKLNILRGNGTNIDKKQADWLPVLGSVHPHCRCLLHEYNKGEKWDKEKKDFVIDKEAITYKPEEGHKDKITVGDKVFYV